MKTPTVHNPTNFDPKDYEVEDYLDNRRPTYSGGDPAGLADEIKFWEADMARVLGPDWRAKKNRCIHCGNGNIRWITAVLHHPTSEVVVFGSDCTARLGFKDKHSFKLAQLMARSEARKVRFAVWTAREAFLAANPAIAEAIARIDAGDPAHANNSFVKDVLSKLDTYGNLSERQIAAVITSLARDVEYAARKAAEATEVKGPAPVGRVVVTGVVVSMKDVEGHYGWTTKMLLKLDNNSRVWMTAPSKETIERGDRITVRATFKVSDDDTSFAFGSRPSLVSRVAAPAAAPVADATDETTDTTITEATS